MSEDKSDDIEKNGEDGDEEEDSGGKKKLLIILVPIILLLGGGAAAFFTGALDGLLGKGGEEATYEETEEGGDDHSKDKKKDKDKGKDDKKDKKGKDDKGKKGKDDGKGGKDSAKKSGVVFLEMPKMIVSLSSDDDQPRYLSLSVQLELASDDDKSSVEEVMPRVVDQFQTFLRELRVQDLRGTKGLYRLKLELLSRVNAAAYPVEVKNILLQDMIVQ